VTHRGRWPGCVLALAFLAAGCGGAASSSQTTVTYVGVTGGSISYGMTQRPTGCNPNTPGGDTPATLQVLGAVLPSPYVVNMNGGVSPNPNLIVQAELVSAAPAPEKIVYTLNPDAVWSDGVPITAKDFIYAWQQQRGGLLSQPNTAASIAGYRDIGSITGSDKGRTVTVVFRTPFADWQMLFANLLPAHIMEKAGWDPACSTVDPSIDLSGGPFRITRVTPTAIVLGTNPRWWGTKPDVRTITVHIASGTQQLAQWVASNFVQVALPTAITPTFLDQMTSLPSVESNVQLSPTFLQLQMASGATSTLSANVRFAIALSVDRQALVNQQAAWALSSVEVASSNIYAQGESGYHAAPLTTTTTTPGAAPATPTSTSTTAIVQGGSVNFPITPDPTEVADLMGVSGFARTAPGDWLNVLGQPLTIRLVADEGDSWAAATAPQLQEQLEDAGFAVTLSLAPTAAAAGQALADGSADAALIPQTTSPFLSQTVAWYTDLLGPPGQNGSENRTNYDNSTFNSTVVAASQQLNPVTAAKGYVVADTQLWSDVVALPLFTEPSVLIWSRKVGGVSQPVSSNSLLWYAQYWAVRVPESTSNTTPTLPNP